MTNSFLHYTVSGSGNPVIFLHGFMENGTMWDDLIADLPVKAFCVDLNGHGLSPLDENHECSVAFMAEQVLEIVSQEKLEQAIIVGHSLGGYVALELFKRCTTLEHLVLFHSHPWDDSPEKQKDRERVAELVTQKKDFFIQEAVPNLFFKPELHQQQVQRYISMAKMLTPEAISWTALAMKNRVDCSELLVKNPMKFTCVIGNKDKLIRTELLESSCKSAGINTIVLEGIGHMAQAENPKRTLELFQWILDEKCNV